MSDLSKIHSCSGFVKVGCRKLSMLVSGGQGPSSSIDVLNCNTPGPDPVPIAGDLRGSPDSSDPVSTAARRGDRSHCDDGPFSPARCSPITSSGYTEVGFGCWTPYRKMIICLQDNFERGLTIGEGGDTTIMSPGRSPKQPLPRIGLHDPLHGRQVCPQFIAFDQGVGQIRPR